MASLSSLEQLAMIKSKSHSKLRKTRSNLKSETKPVSIVVRDARLAEHTGFGSLSRQAPWNLESIQFIAVAEMLDGFMTDLFKFIDHLHAMIDRFGTMVMDPRFIEVHVQEGM